MSKQDDRESVQRELEMLGSIEAFEAAHGCGPNAYLIRCEGVRIIVGKLTKAIRAELRRAVKARLLGRLPKKGLRPEVFFHINAYSKARDAQEREFQRALAHIRKVYAPREVLKDE